MSVQQHQGNGMFHHLFERRLACFCKMFFINFFLQIFKKIKASVEDVKVFLLILAKDNA